MADSSIFEVTLPVGGTQNTIEKAISTWASNVDVETDPLWQPQMTAGYEFAFYFFGPPFWVDTILKYNPNANFSGNVYPLVAFTVPEGIQFGENRPTQAIDAIGTTRRLSKSKYMGGGWGASRLIFKGNNFEYWAYKFLIVKSSDGSTIAIAAGYNPLDPSTWPKNNTGTAGDQIAYSGTGTTGTNQNKHEHYRINSLVSKVFNYPFGILEVFATPDGQLIEAKYYENCHIQSHAHSVAPGGPVVMRNVSGTFQSAVPIAESDLTRTTATSST